MKVLFVRALILMIICALARAEEEDNGIEIDPDLGIEILEKKEDCPKQAKHGDVLHMHYTGTLADGTKFDSSLDRDEPFQFQLGAGQVIQGWDQGLMGMCIGEKRKLTIPSHLGYGDAGAGDKIPPGSTLIFDVELLDITDGKESKNIFKEIDQNGDNLLSQEEVSEFVKTQQLQAGLEEPIEGEQHDHMIQDIFQHEDKDKDGFISHEEFSGPKHDEL